MSVDKRGRNALLMDYLARTRQAPPMATVAGAGGDGSNVGLPYSPRLVTTAEPVKMTVEEQLANIADLLQQLINQTDFSPSRVHVDTIVTTFNPVGTSPIPAVGANPFRRTITFSCSAASVAVSTIPNMTLADGIYITTSPGAVVFSRDTNPALTTAAWYCIGAVGGGLSIIEGVEKTYFHSIQR